MTEEKKLYRSNTTRTIGGVCGGLAEHFNIDPVVVRAAFVLAVLFGGGGVLIYIILWIVIPEKPIKFFNNTENKETFNTEINKESTMENEFETKEQRRDRKTQHGNLTGGLILITLGILFLIDRFVPQVNFGDLWPVILIVIGITLLVRTLPKKSSDNQ